MSANTGSSTIRSGAALLLLSASAWAAPAASLSWEWPLLCSLGLATGGWLGSLWQRWRLRQLQEDALRFNAQHSGEAMLILDEQGRVQAAGEACEQWLDIGPDQRLPDTLYTRLQQQTALLGSAQPMAWTDARCGHARLNIQQLVLPAEFLPARWRIIQLHAQDEAVLAVPQAQAMLTAMQGARIGLCEFDLDKKLVHGSPSALATLLGLPANEVQLDLGAWLERVHPDDRPQLENALQAIAHSGQTSQELEYRIRHEKQHWEWLEQILQGKDCEDDTHRVLALSQVITPRKLAEAAIRRREQEFRTLVENSSDIIARYDLALRCQFINRSVSRYSPLIRDEHIGKTMAEKGWPADIVQQFENECQTLIDTGQPRCFEMELLLLNRRHIFETRLFPEFDSHGKLTSILSVDREVTDSRLAQRLLSEENAVMEMIASNQPLEDTLAQICTMIETQLAGGRCSVMLLTEDGQHLHVASGPRLPAGYTSRIEGIAIGPEVGSCGTAAYWKRTIIVEDMESSPLWQPYLELTRRFALRACWSTPLFSSQRELLGTFAIYYSEPRTPTPEEMRLVYRSSHITAIALQSDLHEQKLVQLATVDELTHLDNRRHFLQQAGRELKRSQRYQTPMGVLMMDLDHFKNINDQYGHAAGDEVITHFARLCREVLRTSDLTGRLGGEEFAAVLPNTDSNAALAAAERLRQAVSNSQVTVNGQNIHYTVSLGMTLLRETDLHVDDLLKRADKLLYQAKHEGRNRVCHDLALKVV
ncbi:diguanylate cyclase [Aquitalea sp. LB_tupeE]|uniref:diguanylate cyclase n=1 Tax=Aquitalea sp. LB_tupeE TaxID=2748078 RepID=UPI0015BB8311|nr:diguanylate cyclase [Aquitalea sp. LB_tupeE]NWK78125.1 diguanylate cyclase [Aquitalea sp. LB_tupeE]